MAIAVNNIPAIREALTKYGIVNIKLQDSILATIGKESQFKPQPENLKYTTASRIKKVFSRIPENLIPGFVNNPVALGNYVYGGRYGTPINAGFLYRGRGFNQITFLDQYKKLANELKADFVQDPDKLNRIEYAAPAAAIFFRDGIKASRAAILKKYGIDLNNIKPADKIETILKAVININAGMGAADSLVNSETGKALPYLKLVQSGKNIQTTKIILPLILGAALLYFAFK
jgi:predicted chitinase